MVTTIAPLAPKFVKCWSTLIPAAVVTIHPKAQSGGMAIAHQNQVADVRTQDERLQDAHAEAGDGALDGQVLETGAVAHQRGAGGQPDGLTNGGGRDPPLSFRQSTAQREPLRGAEDGASYRAADERRW